MENTELYNRVRSVPDNAIRQIGGGKLKGKSDINPMWRIKTLTKEFGPCGIGWYTEKLSEKIITLGNGEVIILVEINLFVKIGVEWQRPIYGTGGSMLLQFEKGTLVSNDEGMKMAYTDAISVACKALGFAADVYWQNDRTKYSAADSPAPTNPTQDAAHQEMITLIKKSRAKLAALINSSEDDISRIVREKTGAKGRTTEEQRHIYDYLCAWIKSVENHDGA